MRDITIQPFQDGHDFATQQCIARLYDGVFDFVPILHQVLVGNGLFNLFVMRHVDDVVGAAVLKSPEITMPIGANVEPLAWVISDLVTTPPLRRRGLAARMVRHLEGQVVRRGGRIIYLFTDERNEAAIRLYVRSGFRRLRPQGRQAVFAKLIER